MDNWVAPPTPLYQYCPTGPLPAMDSHSSCRGNPQHGRGRGRGTLPPRTTLPETCSDGWPSARAGATPSTRPGWGKGYSPSTHHPTEAELRWVARSTHRGQALDAAGVGDHAQACPPHRHPTDARWLPMGGPQHASGQGPRRGWGGGKRACHPQSHPTDATGYRWVAHCTRRGRALGAAGVKAHRNMPYMGRAPHVQR